MKKCTTFLTLILLASVLATALSFVRAPLAHADASGLGGTTVTVNTSPGDQTDPHVSGDWVSYTDFSTGGTVRYHNLVTGSDDAIPTNGGSDYLSGISGNTIVYTHLTSTGANIYRYDIGSGNAPVGLAPQASAQRQAPAIGNRTVAWQDFAVNPQGYPDVVAYNLDTQVLTTLTNDAANNENIQVSPDGSVIVWDKCLNVTNNCTIWEAISSGGAWHVSQLTSGTLDSRPSTNGQVVVYASQRTTNGTTTTGIYWQSVGGGLEHELPFPTGTSQSRDPRISGDLICFENYNPTASVPNWEIWVYSLATQTLYQVTNTPQDETLDSISVTPDGKARVVWSVLEANENVYGYTFQNPVPGPWWTFGNNAAHTHVNDAETQLSPSTVANLALDWKYTTGDMIFSSPAVVNGVVYVGSQDGKVYALNASTEAVKWTYTTGGGVQNSSPTVMGGLVYIGSRDHNLYALDAATGALRWKYTTGNEIWSSPAYANGVIYIGSYDGNVYALDAFTGALQWSYNTGFGIFSSPAVANGIVYIGSENNQVDALDAASGTLKWSTPIGGGVWSSPAVANGKVYIGAFDGKVYALDASTGTVTWTFPTGNVIDSSPAVDNGIVYIGSEDGNLYALNASSGNKLWSSTTGGAIECSPTVANGVVYFGSNDHTFYALNAATGGTPLYTFTTGYPIVSAPAVVNGMIYIGSTDHSLYAFQLSSGQ